MKLGSYTVNVSCGSMPQKVASGFSALFGPIVGAEYEPLAYLGSKVVNGVNHAILAKQTLITGKDIKNIVVIVLNEKPGDVTGDSFTVVSIEPVLSDTGLMGGYSISPTADIPTEAKAAFDKAFQGFLGSNVKPFMLLATKVVKGFEYVFAAEMSMVLSPTAMKSGGVKSVAIVKVFSDFSEISIDTIVEGRGEEETPSNGALGAPLGEWP